MANKSLPTLGVYVRNKYLNGSLGMTWGYLASVRSLSNQALQFSVLLENGALYTGLPATAIAFSTEAPELELSDAQMWDNISSSIDVFTIDILRYMSCTVKLSSGVIVKGTYRFSIDYCGNEDLSRDPVHWKQAHCIEGENGEFLLYPQYRIQFQDSALCAEASKGMPDYKFNETTWISGS